MVAYTTGLKNLVFFNDVHSYSQLVLTPWGWTIQKCPGKDDMDAVFQRVSILLVDQIGCTVRFCRLFNEVSPRLPLAAGPPGQWGWHTPRELSENSLQYLLYNLSGHIVYKHSHTGARQY